MDVLKVDPYSNNSPSKMEGSVFHLDLDSVRRQSKNKVDIYDAGADGDKYGAYGDIVNGSKEKKQAFASEKIPKRYFWSGALGMIFALVNSCFIFCAWPQSHIFLVPKAWHEFMTTAAIGFIGLFAGSLILNCEAWMNIKEIKTWKNFWFLYLVCAIAWILSSVGYYQIYAVMLGLSPPMPLNIHVCGILTLVAAMSFLWFIIPASVRHADETFWKRYCFYILAQIFRYVAVLEYFVCTWGFVNLYTEYQWIVAIVLPIIREVNAWVLAELCYRSAGTRSIKVKITATHEMACRHAVFLSVALSLLATVQTAFICMALDFVVNLLICLKIIWRSNKKNETIDVENDDDLQELALNEKTVYIIPFAYFICFLVAWFGPNTWIIGNVGNTSWHYGKVEELSQPILIMLAMFTVDLVGIVLWAFLLKYFTKIKYVDGYMHMQKNYWLIMAIHEAYSLNEV